MEKSNIDKFYLDQADNGDYLIKHTDKPHIRFTAGKDKALVVDLIERLNKQFNYGCDIWQGEPNIIHVCWGHRDNLGNAIWIKEIG